MTCLVSQAVHAGVLPPGAIRVRRVDIMDRNGFEKPMVATTILVPDGWQTQGGVYWNVQSACGVGYNIDFRATSPDGRSALHVFPMEQWQWSSMGGGASPGCPVQRITAVRPYLEGLVTRARPGARLLDYRRRPDIEQTYQQLNRTTPMPMGEARQWIEAGEALIAYVENGVDMRETVVSAVFFQVTTMQGMAGVPGAEFGSGSTLPGFAMRAPHGQLDFKAAEMFRKSGRENPTWSSRIAQHNAKIAGIQIQGARERSRIIAQTGEEIRQMQADSWRQYNESSDRTAREASEAIRGVETYNDPYYGGTVQLDNTYEHAWQLHDGSYVLSNDPFFDPHKNLGVGGQRLQATQ